MPGRRAVVHRVSHQCGEHLGDPEGVPHTVRAKAAAQHCGQRQDEHHIAAQRDHQRRHALAKTLHLEEVEIVSLLKQVRCELADKIEKSGVDFRFQLPEEKIYLHLDGQKTCRIFENLMVNITKYAMKGTRAYIQIRREENGYVAVSMRNISEHELTVSPDELTERFVRGDESRNTEGSGLGLAIARSFTEAQGGTMKLEAEDDLFKVTVRWKEEKMEKPPVHTEPVEEADPLKSADLQPGDPQVSDLQPVDPQVSDVQPVSSQPSGLQPSGSRPPVPASFTWWDPEKNEMLEEQEEEKETDEP